MDKKIKVLIVEDETTLARIISDTLTENGYNVDIAYDGVEGLEKYFSFKPSIVITDIMMPNLDGFSFVKQIRENSLNTQILFLSARSAADDVVKGFDLGANDYLRKPFAIIELIARIDALSKRIFITQQPNDQYVFHIKDYVFDSLKSTLAIDDKIIELPNKESQILLYLCKNLNNIVSTKTLMLDLWGNDDYFNVRSLNVFITKLRHHFTSDIQIINVRGVGYKLIC